MSGFTGNSYPLGYTARSIVRSVSTGIVALTLPTGCVQVQITNNVTADLRVYGIRPKTSTSTVTVGAAAASDVGASFVTVPKDNATVTRSLVNLPCARGNAIVCVGASKTTIRALCFIGSSGAPAQPGWNN